MGGIYSRGDRIIIQLIFIPFRRVLKLWQLQYLKRSIQRRLSRAHHRKVNVYYCYECPTVIRGTNKWDSNILLEDSFFCFAFTVL